MSTTTDRASGAIAREVACAHCTLQVPLGLRDPNATEQYCCAGCRTAAAIIRQAGLDGYYRLPERRDRAVEVSARAYDDFAHDSFRALYVRSRDDGLEETELFLSGVHCASCVWLVERVPLILPGVRHAELDVRRTLAHVTWDPAEVTLPQIARALDQLGYAPHPFRGANREALRIAEERSMLVNIGVAFAIAMNVMLLALATYGGWFSGIEREFEQLFRWLSLALTLPAYLGPGRVFLRGAWSSIRLRRLHMDLPVALALTAGMARGAVNTVVGSGPIYFDGVATLIFLLLTGRWLQHRSQRAAADAAELQASLTPSTARVLDADGTLHEMPTVGVMPGMSVHVRSGDLVPADGVITAGRSHINAALLTGESRPVAVTAGDTVYAGTANLDAPLTVCVTATGEATRVGALMRELESSAARRAPVVQLADSLAGWFTAVVLVLAAVTWWFWAPRDPANALDHAIALLIVTCPCALALATPLAISVATGRAARTGLLIKGGDVLEALGTPGVLVLDKTGTITEGRAGLSEWRGDDSVRPLVLAVEAHVNHPLATAFRRAWPLAEVPEASDVHVTVGSGIAGTVQGHRVLVGRPAWVSDRAVGLPPSSGGDAVDDGLTPVWIAVDGAVVAEARFGDPVRADAATALATLRAAGWQLRVLSGDAPSAVQAAARAVGIAAADTEGGADPERKIAAIGAMIARGERVVMVGDGVNDAAAMAGATVGIAVHGGAEAALAASDVYLGRPGLAPLVHLTEGASRTMALLRANVLLSILYNVLGAGFTMAGFVDPAVAAVLMPLSSVIVVATSWRGRTFDPVPEPRR
jgi:Cu2+-exporting ATPase